ncbi:MAG TPA: hypothetical protein VHE30_07460 [Polyangiaceae bacterium]|nr:hypothetical protein [Polyangiaceae bacterium]
MLGALPASAAPSRWDRARVPGASAAAVALRAAVRARIGRDVSDDPIPGAEPLLALRAATLLDVAGMEGSSDPEVLYFLGDSWVTADRGQEERALRVLDRALATAPRSPLAAQGWYGAAVARARLGDLEGARSAAASALALEWDAEARARALLLRAEVDLALGDAGRARRDSEAVLEASSDASLRALARFARAAAFAEADDLPDALAEAWEASRPDFVDSQGSAVTVLDLPATRLLRPFQAFYYRALASMAAAERAELPAMKKTELEWARSQWKRYVAEARVAGDSGAESAGRLLASTERRLANVCERDVTRRGAAPRRSSRAGCD